MSDETVSGSEPELDPEDMEEEEEDEEDGEEEDEEEEEEDDNDGDDEEDVQDKNDKSQSAALGADRSEHKGKEGWKHSATSGKTEQEERADVSEEAKQRAQNPAHRRRNIRKLLREDQLEAVTKTAQQEEMERRKRLEQQRKDYPVPAIPTLPAEALDFLHEEIELSTGAVSQLVTSQEIICLDSSSGDSEDDSKDKLHGLTDEIIELSSGEDESLQIVDSGDSTNETDEDLRTESSGSHVNDAFNQPDPVGRVLVNINHPPNEKDIYLAPQLARSVKPHQIGGIRFLYDNLVESLDRFSSSSGFGCILAHTMGLGKTLQVISFLDVLFQHTPAKTVLAIVPVNTLQNWLAEFNMWLPAPETLPPDHNPEEFQPRGFNVHTLNDEHKTTAARAKVVNAWVTDGGVLLMGYEMYRLLSLKKSFTVGRKKRSKKATGPVIIDLDEEDRQQEMLKGIEKALSRPGPDVVICDEGHRIKNCHASTSQALKNIRSRRRVVLTGYPLQNNLIEYWCMVDFVRPDFLGTRQEFSNMFERPILNGQCTDSTPQDKRLMRYRSHVLHSLLEGFVQRRGHTVLKAQLPYKEEHVILVRLSQIQRALYTEFMNRFRDAGNSGLLGLNPLKAFCVCCKIWNHPDVLYEALQKENLANEQDLDVEDLNTNARCQPQGAKVKVESGTLAALMGETASSKLLQGMGLNTTQERANQVVTYEWAKEIFSDYQTGLLQNSPKMVLLFHLIEESMKLGDKILVFSQSLSTLSIIEEFLAKRTMPVTPGTEGQEGHTWIRNVNYYRLDGSTSASERERLINQFNDPGNENVWLFLLSTRAGCLGVNLIGANRVVVFDASWNPCHDAQAVCRVYRYGQRKPCHIYRLVSDFTLEKKIYDRQISKQGMSDRVVDDLNPDVNFTRREVENLLHFVEEEPDPSRQQMDATKYCESVLQKACLIYPNLITREPFQHESLLLDRKEQKLTLAEKKAAKRSYEEEKRASVPYTRPSYTQYYPAPDHNLANIPAFNQRNWRHFPKVDDRPVASVRPLQSTPIPMMPRHAPLTHPGPVPPSSVHPFNFPVNYLQRAGVLVQKVVTTTDIVIPGMTTSTDVQARISAGESIHVIRGTKGTYIRTSDGRIFAIRASGKKSGEGRRSIPSDSQGSSGPYLSNGRHTISSPSNQDSEDPSRPLSPDSPEILNELQQYAEAAAARGSHAAPQLGPQNIPLQRLGKALNLQSRKRKEPLGQTSRWNSMKRAAYPSMGYPNAASYGVNPSSMNHALSRASNSGYLGAGGGSSHFQLPSLLSDPQMNLPMVPNSILTPSSGATSAPTGTPPYLLPPNYPLPFSQPLLPQTRMFAPFPSPLLNRGLSSNSAASTFSGYLSSQSGYSVPSPAGTSRSFTAAETELGSSEEDGRDDDVMEVTGK